MPNYTQTPGHSICHAHTFTCSGCGRQFEAAVWLAVDTTERPDLFERIRVAELHKLTCPHCGKTDEVDAPLLLLRPNASPPLVFSPGSQMNQEQAQGHASGLVGSLRQSLGDAWQDQWLAEGVKVVSREALPALLSDDPQTTLHARLEAAMQTQGTSSMPDVIRAALEQAQQGEERYWTTGDQEALAGALAAWQRILDDPSFPTSDKQFQCWVRNACGGAYLRRYLASGGVEDHNRALNLFQQAVAGTSPGSPAWAGFLSNLGAGLRERFQRTGQLEDLEQAIQVYRKAVACTPPDSPELPHYLNNLGIGLSDRHGRTGRIEDIEEAIGVWRQALAATPPESPEVAATLSNLGNGLSYRYGSTGRLEDLDEAVQVCEQGVTATLPGSPQLPSHLYNLGNRLSDRYKRTGGLEDLEQAIRVYRQAVELAPSDSRHLPIYLWALGIGLSDRYGRTARVEDLDEAINAWEQAVARTPLNSPEFPRHLNSLGIGLFHRYMLTERLEVLEEAIRVWRQAISLAPDSPELSLFLNGLGNGLCYRHLRTGRLEDLDEAIRSWREAVDRTPPESPDRASRLSNLGNGLSDRYRHMGRLEDMEEAIRVYQQAVSLTPLDSPELPSHLNNLGNGLLHLGYRRTGRLDDLEEAIRVHQQAVELTPPESPELPTCLNNLGNGLHVRYERTGSLTDLEEAIRVYRRAVERTPPGSVQLPCHLNNLSIGLSDRYRRTGHLDDLEEAIQSWQQVAKNTPVGSPQLSIRVQNLGRGLYDRYENTGRLEDLEEAIHAYRQAIAHSPSDSPGLARFLATLGDVMGERYRRTGQLRDLEEGRSAYQRAGELGCVVDPEAAIISGRSWVHWAFGRAAWQETTTACQGVFAALDRLLREQVLRSGKESWLREAQGVAGLAAYALAREGRAEQAVIALEQGRVRLLAEALEHTRRDLERLPQQGHADAYRRFRNAAETVQSLQQPIQEDNVPPVFDRHQAIQTARAELDAAIAAIRGIAGFEDFLIAPDWERIQRTVTPEASLVYLVTTPAGSLALIVQRPENGTGSHPLRVTPVWLDGFDETDLDELLIERSDDQVTGGYLPGQLGRTDWLQTSLDRLLPRLGEKLMGPLAERLRATDVPALHVVLIPTGRLSLLPLHASRYVVDGRHVSFVDEFTSSYAISATVLAKARHEALVRRATQHRLVGVGNPLPDRAALAELRAALREALAALPEAAAVAQARAALARLLDLPVDDLVHQGRDLTALTVQIFAALEARAESLLALALQWPSSLRHAHAELESIADMLPAGDARTLFEHDATRQTLLDALPGANLLHLACHGQFQADDPLASGLLLADGELTLRDIIAAPFTALDQCRLAVLSACQTAIQDFRNLPDEAIGLPAGLTQAGVPAVVGSLWSVDDASTALLMVRFYELLLQDRLPPPVALRQAQRWLRDATNAELDAYLSRHETIALAQQNQSERMPLTAVHAMLGRVLKGDPNERPYSHPYYWAPFVFYGAEGRAA